jgi:hypothetical protein
MKMDMLLWNKLNPEIKITDTKKKFFNRYLYKAVIDAPMCRLILSNHVNLTKEYQHRLDLSRHYNYGGSWKRKHTSTRANISELAYYQNLRLKNTDELKFRIEEPYLSIYANNEQFLYDTISQVNSDVKEIHRPANDHAKAILDQGQIVIKKPTDYEYKVVLRESGSISYEVREQVYNYLAGLTDTVKMTKGCKSNLTERHHWFTSTYFYTKDPSVLTFLNLISPDIVSGIFKLSIATDK